VSAWIAKSSLPPPGCAKTFWYAVLNAPKGLAVVCDRLYVADIDRVVGFDIETRKSVFEAVWSPARQRF
jgi:hypothetical protein